MAEKKSTAATKGSRRKAAVAKTRGAAKRLLVRQVVSETWRVANRAELEALELSKENEALRWRRDRLTALDDGTGAYIVGFTRTRLGEEVSDG